MAAGSALLSAGADRVACGCLLARLERFAHLPLRAAGFRSRFVATSVGRIHALDVDGRGDGPPLVLLHGYSAAAIHYAPLIRRLRPLAPRLLAVDLPAHGLSDDPRPPLDGAALRAGLLEALDGLLGDLGGAVLFGNSMGGLAAIRYALARPHRVRGLLLCSPAGAAMDERELAAFRDSLRVATHADALAFTDRLLPPGSRMRHPIAWGVRQKFARPAMRLLLESLRPSDLLRPDELRTLAPPTLVIWGGRDRILPEAHREFFRAHRPAHAAFEEPADFSHSPYLENAPALTARIARFLDGIAAAPAAAADAGLASPLRRSAG